ncbi:MAG: alpha/beta hydrolase [Agriterribacter sp.]
MEKKSIVYNDVNVFYKVTGEGAPVVLIHGFAEDGTIWKCQELFLKDHFRLIIPDIPGSGQSDYLPLDNITASGIIDRYADIIKKIIDKESVKNCVVIGHSMGGYIALAFAQKYADNLNGLGLFHSTAFADTDEKKKNRIKGIEFIQKHGAQEFLKQSIPNLFGSKFTAEHRADITELINASGNFTSLALVHYYEAMMHRPDRTEVLKNISKPVLFIMGEEDKSVYLQDSLSQCHLPLLSLIDILPDVAHMGMWEMKDQANVTVMKFLNYTLDV